LPATDVAASAGVPAARATRPLIPLIVLVFIIITLAV
jgi:hypothetical protein